MMSSTLIVGNLGAMGIRYRAVFDYLKEPYIGIDKGDRWPDLETYGQVLICTPTETHMDFCIKVASLGKNILCEKPVSKSIKELYSLKESVCFNQIKFSWVKPPPSLKTFCDTPTKWGPSRRAVRDW